MILESYNLLKIEVNSNGPRLYFDLNPASEFSEFFQSDNDMVVLASLCALKPMKRLRNNWTILGLGYCPRPRALKL